MSQQIILSIPEEISERAKQIAESTSQPIEQVLIAHLQTLGVPILPVDEQAELDALHHLSDDALWTIAREQLPFDTQHRATDLMNKNSLGNINHEESLELEMLVLRADRLMLRKAEASTILQARGYLFTQQDFKPYDE
jgi:hypothetical protein